MPRPALLLCTALFAATASAEPFPPEAAETLEAPAAPDRSDGDRPAAAPPSAPSLLDPAHLALSGPRRGTYSRTFLLPPGPSPTAVVPLNLHDRDGLDLPPDALSLVPHPVPGAGDDTPSAFRLQLDTHAVPAGLYEGEVLLLGATQSWRLPARLEVKDGPLFPMLVLLFGVTCGLAMTRYQEGGKDRDELIVAWGQLPTAASEPKLPEAWLRSLRARQLEFDAALRAQRWSQAREQLAQAQATWLAWQRDRDAWLAVDAFAQEVVRLDALDRDEAPFPRAAHDAVHAALAAGPAHHDPNQTRDAIEQIRHRSRRYHQLRPSLRQAQDPNLDPTTRRALLRQVEQLPYGDDAALNALCDEVEAFAGALVSEQPAHDGPLSFGAEEPAGLQIPPRTGTNPLPTADQSSRNLRLFSLTTSLITVAVIAWAGFQELYSADPTFGANRWGDYATLLAWGLFSESARNAAWKTIAQTGGSTFSAPPEAG